MVGDPRHGRAVGGGRLHPGPRPTGLGPAGRAVAVVRPRVGGRRAGAVAALLSARRRSEEVGQSARGLGLLDFVLGLGLGYIEGAVVGPLIKE